MERFVTTIQNQSIMINGAVYTASDCRNRLQDEFIGRYGAESFQASLAGFLAEWFDGKETLRVHTSGSTGKPKELWVEKRRMMNSAMLTVDFLNLQRGDTALLCMPLQYIAGKMVVVRALVAGLNLLPVTPCGHPMAAFDEAPVFAAMIPMQVFNTLQVPEEKEKLMRVRHLIIGGGAIDEQLGEALKPFPHEVWSTYGMTETLSHIALRKLNGEQASAWYTPFSSVTLSQTEEGTLVIEAPSVTAARLITNDIVEFDSRGCFKVLGRKDNTINTGGVKVQIEQVEESLRPHLLFPFMITSVPDAKFGERIVLLAETGTESGVRIAKAVEELPVYWRPKQTFYMERIPLTETGKPDRATAKRIAADNVLKKRQGVFE